MRDILAGVYIETGNILRQKGKQLQQPWCESNHVMTFCMALRYVLVDKTRVLLKVVTNIDHYLSV